MYQPAGSQPVERLSESLLQVLIIHGRNHMRTVCLDTIFSHLFVCFASLLLMPPFILFRLSAAAAVKESEVISSCNLWALTALCLYLFV